MYRCEVCRKTSTPGAQRLTHTIKRPNGQVHQEMAVCRKCKLDLEAGCDLRDLLYIYQTEWDPRPKMPTKKSVR